MKSLLKYWGIILVIITWVISGSVWMLKIGWRVDALEKRVLVMETDVKSLTADNLIRKGAAEVWRARGRTQN